MRRLTEMLIFIIALFLILQGCAEKRIKTEYITIKPGDWVVLGERKPELPRQVLLAIEKVPTWLKDELRWKMEELYLTKMKFNGLSSPALLDINSDGLNDLIVGTKDGIVEIFLNVGSKHHPIFKKVSNLYPGIDVVDDATPFPVDVDGDGDIDLVFGNNRGKVILYENVGLKNGRVQFKERRDFFVVEKKDDKGKKKEEIDVGEYSVPLLFDMNGKGILDLIVGSKDGKIHHFINTGTRKHPEWKEDLDEKAKTGLLYKHVSLFHGINVEERAAPALYYSKIHGKKILTLLVFDNKGEPKVYTYDFGGHVEKKFSKFPPDIYTSHWKESKIVGKMIKPWPPEKGVLIPRVFDFDGDGNEDMLIGSSSGKIHLIKDIATKNATHKISLQNLTGGSESLGGYDIISGGTNEHTALKFLNPKYVNAYSKLILSSEKKYVDEVAFTIAHTATKVLKAMVDSPEDKEGISYSPEVLLENAKELYKIARTLPYVRLVEKRNYTTVALMWKDGKWHELPKKFYYWYIVHPRTRFEAPSYYLGKFWREYLFTNNKYGKSLYEAVKDAKNAYNAIEKAHKWTRVFFEWGEESHDKLPQEPYNANYGSCGEWSIFGVAIGRTLLIPTRLANDWGEDHVWNEFYSDGKWHHWDINSDVKKGLDNPRLYERNWKKFISSVWTIRGDDSIYPISEKYTGLATVKLKVVDDEENKSPIAGAMVVVLSGWAPEKGYDKAPLLSIWGVTDENGEVKFKLGENKYKFLISAPNYGLKTVELQDSQGNKNHIIEGKNYDILVSYGYSIQRAKKYKKPIVKWKKLAGRILKIKTSSFQKIRVPLDYPAKYHYITGNEVTVPSEGKLIYFICSKAEEEKFEKGQNFKVIAYGTVDKEIRLPKGYRLVFLNQSKATWFRVRINR